MDSGGEKAKVLPEPGLDSTQRSPLCASIIDFAFARPGINYPDYYALAFAAPQDTHFAAGSANFMAFPTRFMRT